MTYASDEKWRPINFFFQSGRAKELSEPLHNHKCVLIFKLSNRYYCQILKKTEFSRQIFKNKQTSNFTKIRPVGADLLHCGQTDGQTDRQTDMTKLIATFRNFANAPIKSDCSPVQHEPTGPSEKYTLLVCSLWNMK